MTWLAAIAVERGWERIDFQVLDWNPARGFFAKVLSCGASAEKETPMPRLQGKVALITGGGAGIGRATAIVFAREGARVAIADIDAGAGEETARLAGNGAIAISSDVTEPDSIQRAIRTAVDTFGRLDVLHNNAGGSTAPTALTARGGTKGEQ
jgi:hypothetical protein